jgi:short-subunit dehydrogenase
MRASAWLDALADYRRQIETNVLGVLRTFTDRRTSPGGRTLVIMGSVASHIDAGRLGYDGKFAVRALAESLHGDLKATGVGCTLISPGFVDSDISRVDNRGGLHPHAKDPVPPWLRMKTEQAARVMVNGILRGKYEVIVTFHAKVIIFLARHLPRLTRYLLVRANKGSRPEPRTKD